jgi:hypothetical protein
MQSGLRFGIGALALAFALPWLVSAAEHPSLKAELVDAAKNGARGAATVKVDVTGVQLVDPAASNEMPKEGEGHLHYQLDNGAVIATTAPKLSFHGLTPGKHTVKVMLAKNDHSPMGPEQTLTVDVAKASE